MVSGNSSGAIIAWRDARSSFNYDIYGQSVDSTSSAQWTMNGVPICTAAEGQGSLSAAIDGSGGAIVTWQDSRNITKDIYAQRVQASGVLSCPPNQPSNLSPADRAEGVVLTPTLKCSMFSPAEPGDTHVASQWRMTTTAGDYSSPAFDSGLDSFGLLQVTPDSGRLNGNTPTTGRSGTKAAMDCGHPGPGRPLSPLRTGRQTSQTASGQEMVPPASV
jgi:hypothetical protein